VVERAGHEALDVRDIGLGDAEDSAIAARAKADRLCLLTGDFGFADVRNYPPEQYAGLVVLELPKDATAKVILSLVRTLLHQ
jgi:predicted nuclease of predicted toxin-antitoxin system